MVEQFLIRSAIPADIKQVFLLSNEDAVRANSICTDKIKWDAHVKWFYKRIERTEDPFYIIESPTGKFMGQMRIEQKNHEKVACLSINKCFRGRGLSSQVLKRCSEKSNLNCIYAYVKNNNRIAQKAVERAGYIFVSQRNGLKKYKFLQHKTYIVAEMSANHCGQKSIAKKIIMEAKKAGADGVKVQVYTADTMTLNCEREEFRIRNSKTPWNGESLYHLYQQAHTPWEWLEDLKQYATNVGIDFFATPFDYSAVDFLQKLDIPYYKIASYEAMDYPLIKYAARIGKPMIISTGVSSLQEIQEAIAACESVGNRQITLLKCTSTYPAQFEDMNIRTIDDMIRRFSSQGIKIGLSDHSLSNLPAVAAVAQGATLIEKHFTLDRELGGADKVFSLEPAEFKSLVNDIRATEKILGEIDYSINEENRKFARSLYVVKDIRKGEKLTETNIRSIRPSKGLAPKYYDQVLGKTAKRDLPLGTPLALEDIM